MARTVVKVEGLKELQKALSDLPRATERNVMKRVLMARGQPIADAASQNAAPHRRTGALEESFAVSTKLSPHQKGLHRKMFPSDKTSVEVFVGAGPLPQARIEEFGLGHNAPRPMLRPAWDALKMKTLDGIGKDIWDQIQSALKRRASKLARAAAKAAAAGE